MKIVVDTNVLFSAMLNTESRMARVFLQPKNPLQFYSTEKIQFEIDNNTNKLKEISGYTDQELKKVYYIFIKNIRLIDVRLIPQQIYLDTLALTEDVDIDDTEFVALTEYIDGRFWSGDKKLKKGLIQKGWDKFVSLEELLKIIKHNT